MYPWTFEKHLDREPKKVPVNSGKVPGNLKSAREQFQKECPWKISKKCPRTVKSVRQHVNFDIFGTFTEKSARNRVNREKVPVDFF